MGIPQLKRVSIVIAVCASVGAVAGIAGSAAAPSKASKKSAQAQKKAAALKARALKHAFRAGVGGPGFLGGPVHAEAVVPNEDGTGFVTVTTDAGTLNEVDGTTLHLEQGTDKATYKKDAAIDVGADAKVIRNHQDAKLSDLTAGDHVRVIQGGPKGNVVIAVDDAFLAQQKKRWSERGFHRHGFGGPPPAGPGAPGDPDGPNENGSNSAGSAGGGSFS
jgi:type II secretory pathway pseudopilin PulG